uniref:C-type lectin domain-containing protein n=1 Tax=Dromaius novaehollandiae TaxID=8790 RepID=A0A8C4JYZ8_DRONO
MEVKPILCPEKLLSDTTLQLFSFASKVLCCSEPLLKCLGREIAKTSPSSHVVGNTQHLAFSAHQIRDCEHSPLAWEVLFQKSCYYVSSDEMSWGESEKNCTGMGSHLVVISTEVEQVSAGLREATQQGTFVYSFWKPGEPNLPFDKKCVAIHVKGNTDSSTYSNWNNMLSFTICFRICELTAKYV